MGQTVIQNSKSFRIGSAKFEVGDSVNQLVDLGGMRNVVFEESWEEVWQDTDNAGEVLLTTRNHQCRVGGDLLEIDLQKLANLRGNYDDFASVPGTKIEGAEQQVDNGDWSFNKFIRVANQNADGSKITINSVSGSVAGPLTEETDYIIAQNERGEWGIIVFETSTITNEDQALTIDYDYTPASHFRMTSGGRLTINPKVVRLTNTNAQGKKFQITVYKARATQGISITFNADESGELNVVPISLTGRKDVTRATGDQLFEIIDEQGV